jgi:hypothetical protein
MNKVINYLGLRKVAINLQLDKLPADVDQYVAEVGAELEEELRQIDQALLVLSNVVVQSEQLRAFKQFLQSEYNLPVSNRMVDEFEQKQSS